MESYRPYGDIHGWTSGMMNSILRLSAKGLVVIRNIRADLGSGSAIDLCTTSSRQVSDVRSEMQRRSRRIQFSQKGDLPYVT
jgi:hypothetical protein